MPDDLLKPWKEWKESLQDLRQIAVPRWYFTSEEIGRVELHHFCDASEVGYGSVCYLRKVYNDGRIECAFVMAKSRTAPSHFVSVPRLELQAAVVAVRVDSLVRRELDLPIDRVCFWTDSKIVVSYIQSESRRFKTYVASRVSEIHASSKAEQWRHIAGKLNPADLASRGQSVKAFLKSKQWLKGPEFLRNSEEHWPITEAAGVSEDDLELKQERIVGAINIAGSKDTDGGSGIDKLLERYSSWDGLLRAVVILRKFGSWIRDKASVQREITPAELDAAAVAVVKVVQRSEFSKEIESIGKLGRVKTTSSLRHLNPVLIDGVLRVGGRIANAPVSFDCSFPMIVPKRHQVSNLLIRYFHYKTAHAGQEHVLARLREKFWIPQARSAVRQLLRDCIGCRKRQGPRLAQKMANLPSLRLVAYDPPFTRTGVDYYGPMLVKRGRSSVKRWGVLFTCLNVRAVHLEVAESMDTSTFLNALRRFIGRRGCPSDIWSDNGTNFVGGERELREALDGWNHSVIERELAQQGIRWHFQPPGASHMSGVWERLVKSTKLALKAILGESLVSDEVLHTVHVEVEAILNSRPLCKASEDPKDEESLTPSHFLMQRRATTLPPGEFVDEDIYHRKRWRQTQILAEHFWKRFIREYLTTLQQRSKWLLKSRSLEKGDLVLVADDGMARGQWPMAIVMETFPGEDGCVRVVNVRTSGGSVLKRSVHKLCLLEESDRKPAT